MDKVKEHKEVAVRDMIDSMLEYRGNSGLQFWLNDNGVIVTYQDKSVPFNALHIVDITHDQIVDFQDASDFDLGDFIDFLGDQL